jgi:hypothetical protein
MFLSLTAQLMSSDDWISVATATPTTTLIGRDTLVSVCPLSLQMKQSTNVMPGTSRFYELNGMEKPKGFEKQQS